MTFVDRILAGDIDDPDLQVGKEIDRWVADEQAIGCHTYLGMTLAEWVRFEAQGRKGLREIIGRRNSAER
jgi:hypothetical protein